MGVDRDQLDEIPRTSFGQERVLERSDLQRILRDQPDVLEQGLLIISEEFSNWQDSGRRIDLLGLDATGRLVVVELKRGDTGQHMDLQAIRYAAMVANLTFQQVVDIFQAYLQKRAGDDGNDIDEDDAESRIREHLGNTEGDLQPIHTEIPRIILASEDFGKELTTCVMWLNDSWLRSAGQEIKCIRLQPYRNGNEILVETSVVIPLPEASDYQTQLGQMKQEIRVQSSGKAQHIPGSDVFYENIAKAQEGYQPGLKQLYESAVNLNDSKLAEVSTYVNPKGNYVRLELRVPGKSQYLVSFNNVLFQRGVGEISFWPGWDDTAPNSLIRIGEMIGPLTSNSGVRHRRLSKIKTLDLDSILAVIRDAYVEANEQGSVAI
jgi:hypothetical protein